LIFYHYTKFVGKNFDRRPNNGLKTKFKMAAATILNLLPVTIFNICRLYTIAVNHHTKFHAVPIFHHCTKFGAKC